MMDLINQASTTEEFCDAASAVRRRIREGQDVDTNVTALAFKGHALISKMAPTRSSYDMHGISRAVMETLATEPPGLRE